MLLTALLDGIGWKSPNPGPNTGTVFLAISQTSYQPPDSIKASTVLVVAKEE